MSSFEDPRLPPELEEQIFVLALRADLYEACNLLIVAKRVFKWLNPIIYEVVVKDKGRTWPPNLSIPLLEQYGKHVRHLLLAFEFPDVPQYMELCPNVKDMGLWTGIPYSQEEQDALANLPLTQLSTNVPSMFYNLPPPKMIAMFSKITHLDITSTNDQAWDPRQIVSHFPALTHISLFSRDDMSSLVAIVEVKPDLRVIIWLLGRRRSDESEPKWTIEEDETPLGDDRIVSLSIRHEFERDWEEGARGNTDLWQFAEGVILERAERKAKNISE